MVSCFETENGFIICFYIIKYYNKYLYNILRIGAMDFHTFQFYFNNLEKYQHIFNKDIHLKGEVGVFAYYNSIDSNSQINILFSE